LTGQVDLERQAGQRERARAEEQQKTAADAREALAGLKALAEKKKPGRPKTRQGGAALRRHEVAEHVNG